MTYFLEPRSQANHVDEISFIDFNLPNRNNYSLFEEDEHQAQSFHANNYLLSTGAEPLFREDNINMSLDSTKIYNPREKEIRMNMLMSRHSRARNIYFETLKEIKEMMQSA